MISMETLRAIAKFVQKIFYVFLDMSGILLGVFLTILGWWIVSGRSVPFAVGAVILFLGVAAFLIHVGHYFSWKLTRWLFGENYFLANEENNKKG